MKPRRNWFVRRAKRESTCWICKTEIHVGHSVARYGHKWPHFECAKAHDARICAGN